MPPRSLAGSAQSGSDAHPAAITATVPQSRSRFRVGWQDGEHQETSRQGGDSGDGACWRTNSTVKRVMRQVGHADSTMTMDVYAQLQQRVERQHGAKFDRLVRRAREQLAGVAAVA